MFKFLKGRICKRPEEGQPGQRATGVTLVTHCGLTCQRWTDRNGGQRSKDIATLHYVFLLSSFSKI